MKNEISVSPFLLEGGPIGVLLIHGFTASPTEMRPLGNFLHQRGLTVSGICLPGHGTSPADLARFRWEDWYGAVETEFDNLHQACNVVFVAGLSAGGVLGTLLAAREPRRLRGLCLLCPAFYLHSRFLFLAPLLTPIIRSIPKSTRDREYLAHHGLFSYPDMPTPALTQLHHLIRRGRQQYSQVQQPTLIFLGQKDATVRPSSGIALFNRHISPDRNLVFLPRADHILTVEPGAHFIFSRIHQFIEHYSRPETQKSTA
jgi:carboxylesterase